ncbi:MAG: metalloregulator ArsR/SmtB family transcription factor [Erysipelotrichaceae bacterium]
MDKLDIVKALADSNRLLIIEELKTGEKCACELLEKLDCNQSTLSHHMKQLCEANIVEARKDGKWIYYKLKMNTIEEFKAYVCSLS